MAREKEYRAHCCELVTGKKFAGEINIAKNHIGAKLFGYDEYINLYKDKEIFMRTQFNDIVSFHEFFCEYPHRLTRVLPWSMTTFSVVISSNVAVVGHDRWNASDGIKKVHFTIDEVDYLFNNHTKISSFADNDDEIVHNFEIFKISCAGFSISARHNSTYGSAFDAPTAFGLIFTIDFEEPTLLQSYISQVINYTRFFRFCTGIKVMPSDVEISRYSQGEITETKEPSVVHFMHKVYYVCSEAEIIPDDIADDGSPVNARDDDALESFRACLAVWMERSLEWSEAYALMDASLVLRHKLSSERILTACRWFERIPLSSSEQAIADEDVNAIVSAASEVANARGIPADIQRRISSSLKAIKSESDADRYRRLLTLVNTKFGVEYLPVKILDDLKRVRELRGKAAHGHFSLDSDLEFRLSLKAVLALEALCLLLMAYDLPISTDGKERLRSHPLLLAYRLAG